ncbi:MAG: prepilin-type N-terminal cleavage/methylation domain-containing protein [Gemmataceae bacterium]|nr:prepilin-type N-terminal cleavage/methylation domain-containing protein [Gemmataceae bacterium]
MTRPAATRRPGFTLVELLVAMAVIVVLASIALLVVPDVLSQDRTTDAAGTVRQSLMIAKARALRDGLPRGVRFLVGSDGSNVVKLNAGTVGQLWVTELQFIEQPPPLVPAQGESIEFVFATDPGGNLATDPPGGGPGATLKPPSVYLHLPEGVASTAVLEFINGELAASPPRQPVLQALYGDERLTLTVAGITGPLPGSDLRPGAYALTLGAGVDFAQLARAMGDGTSLRLTTFWVTRPSLPLLGEPTVPLPRNVCVDLNESSPAGNAGQDYDILFAPNGEVLYRGEGQMYLWVRDYTKMADPTVITAAGPPARYDLTPFQVGGEQQVVALKTKSGALGVFPIQWPQADGTYPLISPGVYDDPFGFARRAASSP